MAQVRLNKWHAASKVIKPHDESNDQIQFSGIGVGTVSSPTGYSQVGGGFNASPNAGFQVTVTGTTSSWIQANGTGGGAYLTLSAADTVYINNGVLPAQDRITISPLAVDIYAANTKFVGIGGMSAASVKQQVVTVGKPTNWAGYGLMVKQGTLASAFICETGVTCLIGDQTFSAAAARCDIYCTNNIRFQSTSGTTSLQQSGGTDRVSVTSAGVTTISSAGVLSITGAGVSTWSITGVSGLTIAQSGTGTLTLNAQGNSLILQNAGAAFLTSTSARVVTMATTGASGWTSTGNLNLSFAANSTISTITGGVTLGITTTTGTMTVGPSGAGILNLQFGANSLWRTVTAGATLGISTTTGTLSLQATTGTVTVGTTAAGIVRLQTAGVDRINVSAAGVLSITSTGASSWANTSGALGISTVTSGAITVNGIGGVNIQANAVNAVVVDSSANLTFGAATSNTVGFTARVTGDLVFLGGSANPHVVYPAASTGGDNGSALSVVGGAAVSGVGGKLTLRGGSSTNATGGAVDIRAGTGTGSIDGAINIGFTTSSEIYLFGKVYFGDDSSYDIVNYGYFTQDFYFRYGADRIITVETPGTTSTAGDDLTVRAASGSASAGVSAGGLGGAMTVSGGAGGNGSGGQAPGAGNTVRIYGGAAGTGGTGIANSGGVQIDSGAASGAGVVGSIGIGRTYATDIAIGRTSAQTKVFGTIVLGNSTSDTLTINASLLDGCVFAHNGTPFHRFIGTTPSAGSNTPGDQIAFYPASGSLGTGATKSGDGGPFGVVGGTGGHAISGQSGVAGTGGDADINGGKGGDSQLGALTQPAIGGVGYLRGGTGGTNFNSSGSYLNGGTGGAARVVGGVGKDGDSTSLTAIDGNGGAASLTGGVSGAGVTNPASKGYGGNTTVSGGEGLGVNSGGVARLLGGNSTNTSTSYTGVGGEAQVTGGEARGGGPGGAVRITGGLTTNGGASGAGGDVFIKGGATGGSGIAGDVNINPGLSTGGGTAGVVNISTDAATNTHIGHASGMLQFFGTGAASLKQSVNAMTVGTMSEANDTMDDYGPPTGSYINDDSYIYNNIRRLVYKLDQVVDALRAYGLI